MLTAMASRRGATEFDPARLTQARTAAGLTQKQLAELLGHRHSNLINAWEKERKKPGPDSLRRLAEALRIDIGQLLGAQPATLRSLRLAAGLNQQDVAAAVGVPRSTWSVIERAGRPLPDDAVAPLLALLAGKLGDEHDARPRAGETPHETLDRLLSTPHQ